MGMLVEYDSEAHATYISLVDQDPTSQIEIQAETVVVDLGQSGQPVGVEILLAPAQVTPSVICQ